MRLHLIAALIAASLLGGCGDSTMTMNLDGTMRLEGPIQMQMQGPTIRYEGTYVSEKLMERVDTGKTKTDWILAVLGEPNSKATLDDGSEIWKWEYKPVEQEVSVVSIFGGSKDEPKVQPSIAFVRLRDGVVVEKWRD